MKHILLAAVAASTLVAGSAYAQSNPPEPERPGYSNSLGSASQLKQLGADWDRIGFNAPSKPAQYRVYGRDGHVTSGPGYNAMVALIRSAARDVRGGHEHEAQMKIASVRSLLGPTDKAANSSFASDNADPVSR
jgi:hypothetical protein